MGQLEYLHLQQNYLTGTLPTTVGKMTSLRSIQLYKNKFEGLLPAEMNSWTNLKVLALQQNKFNGKIPYLAGLIELEFLLLHENLLSMHVPFEIFRLLHLVEFNIGKNFLTGTVPSELESGGKLRKSSVVKRLLVATAGMCFTAMHLVDLSSFSFGTHREVLDRQQ
jgi:Leucine-rich repeat (LRR) protein